jgi:hypothetical protein
MHMRLLRVMDRNCYEDIHHFLIIISCFGVARLDRWSRLFVVSRAICYDGRE